MAKFAVGEIAEHRGNVLGWGDGEKVEIILVGCPAGTIYRGKRSKERYDYLIKSLSDTGFAGAYESDLRKLPGDSTSLPSWLTNMLKVPHGDPDKVKQPEKVK